MTGSPTQEYIDTLTSLKDGDISLLRILARKSLDQTVLGFDLFAGLWWPLQNRNARAPQRDVAWLIAKLYAAFPLQHNDGDNFARQLGRCRPSGDDARDRFERRFDHLLVSPSADIEDPLRWGLDILAGENMSIDWVKLTDDLSIWERESTRLHWIKQFLGEE
jgi:CRISPR type I-E-associated protein CasB/Cse2